MLCECKPDTAGEKNVLFYCKGDEMIELVAPRTVFSAKCRSIIENTAINLSLAMHHGRSTWLNLSLGLSISFKCTCHRRFVLGIVSRRKFDYLFEQ